MPNVELLNRNAHADGWHDVRSPGGYEWWYFDAEDAATDTQVVAIFMQGFIFHPGYLRQYARYHRRPTRHVPPTACDFPCVYLCVYRGGKIGEQFFTQYRREDFSAAADRVEVQIGPNRLWIDERGAYRLSLAGTPWKLTTRGPQTLVGQSLRAELTFEPRFAPRLDERRFLSEAMTGAEHQWTIAAPACAVSGTISGASDHAFAGRGYHDHNYGTAPIGHGLARWTWGRAMFAGDRGITFHHAEPRDRSLPLETHLLEATPAATRDLPIDRVMSGAYAVCNPAMRLRYPLSLDFGDALRLTEPRVIDPSPFYLRLQFTAESFGERSTAFCEIAYPHRLRWPLLGRMIELSFDKRALKAR